MLSRTHGRCEQPPSPERDDAPRKPAAVFPNSPPPATAGSRSRSGSQQHEPSNRRSRSNSSTTCATPWTPDEDEVRALAMRDFDVLGVLGVGTYGVVKLARHVASGASVALKVLSKEHVVSLRQEKHILRERAVHLQLQHAFVARLYGTFQDADCLYLVIEYLPGGELWSLVYSDFDNNDDNDSDNDNDSHQLDNDTDASALPPLTPQTTLKRIVDESPTEPSASDSKALTRQLPVSPSRRGRSQSSPAPVAAHVTRLDAKSRGLLRSQHGGLHEDHAVFYLACIQSALEYLHAQQLLYRDLKLENLVLDRGGYPKVLDFGFAKPDATSATARNLTLCGSMDYMAPEILLHEPHDQRVDVWSFGIIMYELLLGKTPFFHENPREQGRKITTEPVEFPSEFVRDHPDASDLIRKLLVKRPDDRVGSMRELKSHAFFTRYFPLGTASWDALERRERPAPFVPKLAGPFDTSFFDALDSAAQDELDDELEPYFEDGSHIFSEF